MSEAPTAEQLKWLRASKLASLTKKSTKAKKILTDGATVTTLHAMRKELFCILPEVETLHNQYLMALEDDTERQRALDTFVDAEEIALDFIRQIDEEIEADKVEKAKEAEQAAQDEKAQQALDEAEAAKTTQPPQADAVEKDEPEPSTVNGAQQQSASTISSTQQSSPPPSVLVRRPVDAWIDDLVNDVETVILDTQSASMQQNEALIRALFQRDEPTVELLHFDGNPRCWPRFAENFYDGVHNLPFMTDNKRMNQLQSHVTGRALELIQGLGFNGRNYARALKYLKAQCGHRSLVAKAFLDSITTGDVVRDHDRKALQHFHISIRDCLFTLRQMCYDADVDSSETIRRTTRRLPTALRNRWGEQCQRLRESHEPTLTDLEAWLSTRVDAMFDPLLPADDEQPTPSKARPSPGTGNRGNQQSHKSASFKVDVNPREQPGQSAFSRNCPACDGSHRLYRCRKFYAMSPQKKIELVKNSNICVNCFQSNHVLRNCQHPMRCRAPGCNQRHHTLIHDNPRLRDVRSSSQPDASPVSDDTPKPSAPPETSDTHAGKTSIHDNSKSTVYLQLLPVKLHGTNGASVHTYALLDSACQSSFIREEVARKLHLSGPKRVLDITTLLDVGSIESEIVSFRVSAPHDDAEVFEIPWAWTLKDLRAPPQRIRGSTTGNLQHLADLMLHDIRPEDVGVVIGANQPEAILAIEMRKGPPGKPIGVKTPLGWTVMGVENSSNLTGNLKVSAYVTISQSDDLLHQQVQAFFDQQSDECTFGQPSRSIEDLVALKILDTETLLVDGRYQVPMLWKAKEPQLADNHYQALKQFESLLVKFKQDPQLFTRYQQVIHTHLTNGYARTMSAEEINTKSAITRYQPHHAVFNPNKPNKLRVVFNAASKTKGSSMNDALVTGPDLLNSLAGILVRFRRGSVAIAGDVEAMFHRVLVPPAHKDCLRFYWQDDLDAKHPDVLQMNVHIFGAKCSPTCSEYALQRAARDNTEQFSQLAIDTTIRDFYVDDLLTSLPTEDEAAALAIELIALLQKGGFRLTKWTSNSRHVLASLPQSELARTDLNLDLDKMPIERVLGMHWDTEKDCLIFRTAPKDAPMTKRGALSVASAIFDPLGYQAPFVVRAKLLIQELWRAKIGWDDVIPEPMLSTWKEWLEDLPNLSKFSTPRCYSLLLHNAKSVEVHTFVDASERALGAVSYLRIAGSNDEVVISFLKANANCAPMKQLGTQRLETQACVIGVRQNLFLNRELHLAISRNVFWSDSTTALQYIRNSTRRFHTYIANRVAEIREASEPSQWYHCPGVLNPADDCSRGLSTADINDHHRFIRGPAFLLQPPEYWPPAADLQPLRDDDAEVKPEPLPVFSAVTTKTEVADLDLLDPRRFSRLSRLTRVTAWLFRFLYNVRVRIAEKRNVRAGIVHPQLPSLQYSKGPLTPSEVDNALFVWVRHAQNDVFRSEINALTASQSVPQTSSLLRLHPIIINGLLRVGGRVDKAPLPYDARHQLILPCEHPVTTLTIVDAHSRVAHAGQEHVMASLRERFWIVRARVAVRKVTRSCIICHRRRITPAIPAMAELPAYRLDVGVHPFTNTGVDYFGPLQVKVKRSVAKRWACLFTCLTTRAIHIELATSLDVDAFILALRRFTSRRGCPKSITSDNGTNFHGAHRELKECVAAMDHQEIARRLNSTLNIVWKFNPPAGPHFGGVWERLVRSVKTTLRIVIGNETLQEDVLHTALVEVESLVNSRPLTAISDCPDDFQALTPNHFLIGRPYPDTPPDVPAIEHMSHRKRWRHAQTISERSWSRFRKQYIPELAARSKLHKTARNLAVNDLVLVVSEHLPRGKWCLARVLEPLPGKDNVVRAARIKTATGVLVRPVSKLCLLEGSHD